MKYNRFILQHLMENKFIGVIRIKVANDIGKFDEYDLDNIFFDKVDILALSTIAGISIEYFDTDNKGDGTAVYGDMIVSAEVNGFIKQNRKWVIVGGGMLNLGYSFYFIEQNGKLGSLELEYSY